MFCKNCGAKLDEGSKFCSGCGMAVNAEGKLPETVAENPQPNPYMNQQAATMENAYQQNTYQQNTYQQNAYGGTAYNAASTGGYGKDEQSVSKSELQATGSNAARVSKNEKL